MIDKEQRPLILVVNDDGFRAQGIQVLARRMMRFADVLVVAPDHGRSGASCSITSSSPVRLVERSCEVGIRVFSCSGTPVDCVKLAVEQVCEHRPDLLVSGINHGDNASISVHYSGTMGAAIEACMKGIPAIGFSLKTRKHTCDFEPYMHAVDKVVSYVLERGLPKDVCLNVNFPEVSSLRGVRVCRMSRGQWTNEWVSAHHPRTEGYFWLAGDFENLEPEATDTDCWALAQGYAAITPIQLDLTAHGMMDILKRHLDVSDYQSPLG